MLALIALALSIGIVDSLNPSTIVPALYLATGKSALRNLSQFIAGVVGWGRTVGCIVGNNFAVDLYEPGCVRRTMPRVEMSNIGTVSIECVS